MWGLALITISLIVTLGDQMSQFGLALIQGDELFISDISSTFWTFLGVDNQSVHFEANCHRGRSVTVDQKYSGRSMVVQMSLGHSVGGRSVKVPTLSPLIKNSRFRA